MTMTPEVFRKPLEATPERLVKQLNRLNDALGMAREPYHRDGKSSRSKPNVGTFCLAWTKTQYTQEDLVKLEQMGTAQKRNVTPYWPPGYVSLYLEGAIYMAEFMTEE